MSSELILLKKELRALQGELVILRERVDRQEERIAELEGFEVIDKACEVFSPPAAPAASAQTGPSASSSSSDKGGPKPEVDWNFRLRVAREIGCFLSASLAGERTGVSSRAKIPLRSSVYVLVRDRHGVVSTEPVRVYRSWGSFRKLVEDQKGALGDCMFVGFPSQKEAQVAVTEAGFRWPESIEG